MLTPSPARLGTAPGNCGRSGISGLARGAARRGALGGSCVALPSAARPAVAGAGPGWPPGRGVDGQCCCWTPTWVEGQNLLDRRSVLQNGIVLRGPPHGNAALKASEAPPRQDLCAAWGVQHGHEADRPP